MLKRKLERERKSQISELVLKEREADRYRTSQMKGTLLSLVEGIRLNIILNYSVELLERLNLSAIPSEAEGKKYKSYFKKEFAVLKKKIYENEKESAKYRHCLVKSQLDNVIEDQDKNRSLIKMNEVLLNKLMNDSIPNYASLLKKKISADKKESEKYKPCMHKTIIDLRTLISQCTLGLVDLWGDGVDNKKMPQLKKAIIQDKKEIANYKPSHYQFLLEFRKTIHTNQLLECYKNNGNDGTASLLKDIKSTKNKYSRESKKYAPCTHKYLLEMVSEYNDHLINTYT